MLTCICVIVFHEQVPTNGSSPHSFQYPKYNQKFLCHMQLERLSVNDWANTPNTLNLTSDDSSEPQTWGLDALKAAGGDSQSSTLQELSVVPLTLLTIVDYTATSYPPAIPRLPALTRSPTATTNGATGRSVATQTSTSSSSTALPPSTGSSTAPSPTTTSRQPEQSSGGGLDIGKTIGIIVGVIGVIATLFGAWCSWKLYLKKK